MSLQIFSKVEKGIYFLVRPHSSKVSPSVYQARQHGEMTWPLQILFHYLQNRDDYIYRDVKRKNITAESLIYSLHLMDIRSPFISLAGFFFKSILTYLLGGYVSVRKGLMLSELSFLIYKLRIIMVPTDKASQKYPNWFFKILILFVSSLLES